MRKVIAGTFVTLDGVMQAPGGPEEDPTGGFAHGGWTVPYWDEPSFQALSTLFEAPFDLLLGRRTYEIFAAHWPFVEDEPEGDPIAIARRFNAATKYVATRSHEPLTWKNSVALRGDVPAEVARLKQEDGPLLVIQGSSVLIQSLLAKGLIDEFSLLVFPLVLGSGKRLFGDGALPAALRLIDSKSLPTGIVMSRYLADGAVSTGSFALEQPTDAEIARREKMRLEEMA
jgi:dihydrofolate reductase